VAKTGGLASSWFLLYFFPVMSLSRYLGRSWTIRVALSAVLMYCVAAILAGSSAPWTVPEFWGRAVVLLGVAIMATNLTRSKDDSKLLNAIEKIDREILSNADLSQVMNSILHTAMDVTGSKMSAIALIDGCAVVGIFTAAKYVGSDDAAGARSLMDMHVEEVMRVHEPLALPKKNRAFASIYRLIKKSEPRFWGGRLVFLEVEARPVAVLGVFSRRLLHFNENDAAQLSSMAPLVALVRKNAAVYPALRAAGEEKQERLKVLHGIGGQLKTEIGLDALFAGVVNLASESLGAEEAALFVPDDRGHMIVKSAVQGPGATITTVLANLETGYAPDERSLTRSAFDGEGTIARNAIPANERYAAEYAKALPSGKTQHYIGVPLRLGTERFGVIRVLNKKLKSYSLREPGLDDRGFTEEDQDLLETIATQVAAAIRSANFIEKNRYFQDLLYQSPDAIIVLDKDGRILNFNEQAEKIWNTTEERVLHQSVVDFYSSADEARRVGRFLWEHPEHTISDFATWIKGTNGVQIPIRLSARMRVKGKKRLGSIGLFKDQRERIREVEERVSEEKLEALGKLAHTAGHAIKNDLGTILNNLLGLERGVSGNRELLNLCSAIRGSTEAARARIQNMLLSSRADPPMNKTGMSLRRLLNDFEESTSHLAAITKIRFQGEYYDYDPLVYAERDQLQQVLINLFENSVDAIKKARRKGRRSAGLISLKVETKEETVALTWSDDGIGIPEESLVKVFTPFFTTKDTGNGLGLFITKSIVENHGGIIIVEPGQRIGVCFRITLPLHGARMSTEVLTE
jgi:PAS domain S-box-containing protein